MGASWAAYVHWASGMLTPGLEIFHAVVLAVVTPLEVALFARADARGEPRLDRAERKRRAYAISGNIAPTVFLLMALKDEHLPHASEVRAFLLALAVLARIVTLFWRPRPAVPDPAATGDDVGEGVWPPPPTSRTNASGGTERTP